MQHTVIAGAGLSRSFFPTMPLTDELGELIAKRLGPVMPDMPRVFCAGGFETWLSGLAEDQPYLNAAENLANRAGFLRVAEAVREVIVEAENTVLAHPPPRVLQRLIALLHLRRSTVVTFNYDTLIERAVTQVRLFDTWTNNTVSGVDAIKNRPSEPFLGYKFVIGAGGASTFGLLKLHGSTDTFWVAGDVTGSSINRFGSLYWHPGSDRVEDRRVALPDRSPFIVPPAATKSAFYGNPLTRQMWFESAQALAASDVVDVVGYSLPTSDLVVSGMLASKLGASQAKVRVVNPDAETVAARLLSLGIKRERIELFGGEAAVGDWLTSLEISAGEDAFVLAQSTAEALRHAPIVVAHHIEVGALCTGFHYDVAGNQVLLEVGPVTSPYEYNRSRSAADPKLPTLSDFPKTTSPPLFVACFDDGSRSPIIELRTLRPGETGHSTEWAQFVPSFMPLRPDM